MNPHSASVTKKGLYDNSEYLKPDPINTSTYIYQNQSFSQGQTMQNKNLNFK